jgi:hypothetical protein
MDEFHLFSSGRRARRVRTHARATHGGTFLTSTMNEPYFSHRAICVRNNGH